MDSVELDKLIIQCGGYSSPLHESFVENGRIEHRIRGVGRTRWKANFGWEWIPDEKYPSIKITSNLTLNKGDKAVLKSSGRIFEVIDESKEENGGFLERVKFEDDPRHPVWISHAELSSETRYMTDEERERWEKRNS